MDETSNAGSSPVHRKVMHHELHSEEAMERAAITLRQMTQERGGRGISAVMMFEEQVRDITKQRDELLDALQSFMFEFGDKANSATVTKARAAIATATAMMHNVELTGAEGVRVEGTVRGEFPGKV